MVEVQTLILPLESDLLFSIFVVVGTSPTLSMIRLSHISNEEAGHEIDE